MAREISTNSSILKLNLSAEQKARLKTLADRHGYISVSAFIGAVADGKLSIIDSIAAALVEHIIANREAGR